MKTTDSILVGTITFSKEQSIVEIVKKLSRSEQIELAGAEKSGEYPNLSEMAITRILSFRSQFDGTEYRLSRKKEISRAIERGNIIRPIQKASKKALTVKPIKVDDWICQKNTRGYRSYSRVFDGDASGKSFIRLSERDVKAGNVNQALSRNLAIIGNHYSTLFRIGKADSIEIKSLIVDSKFKELLELLRPFIKLKATNGSKTTVLNSVSPPIVSCSLGVSLTKEVVNAAIKNVIASGNSAATQELLDNVYEFLGADTLAAIISRAQVAQDMALLSKAVKRLEALEPMRREVVEGKNALRRMDSIRKIESSSDIAIEKLNEFSGQEFEKLVGRQFERLGYAVEYTPPSGDYGADLLLTTESESRIVVQCKRFASRVNLKAVQEVIGALGHYAADYGVVITNNEFLNSAINLASTSDVELWNSDRLLQFLSGDLSFSELKNM